MRKIVFDLLLAQPVKGSKYHGGGEYTKNVFRLFLRNNKASMVFVCYDYSKYIEQEIKDDIAAYDVKSINVAHVDDIVAFLYSMPSDNNVIFFAGMVYQYTNVVFPKNIHSVGVCHGLRYVEVPKDRYSLFYSRTVTEFIKNFLKIFISVRFLAKRNIKKIQKAINAFDTIYTVSNHSKYAIKTLLPSNKEYDIRVHYQTLRRREPSKKRDDNLDDYKDYILLISSDRWEKNSYRGITALDELMTDGKLDVKKVVVLGNYPKSLRNRIRNTERFIFLGYLDSNELEIMYENCRLFFYPTLNEGYGLPPLEAMKHNKTCVISSVCSLPEVYSNSVYYCNPYNLSEIKTRLVEALEMPIDKNIIQDRIALLEKEQELSTKNLIHFLCGENEKDCH